MFDQQLELLFETVSVHTAMWWHFSNRQRHLVDVVNSKNCLVVVRTSVASTVIPENIFDCDCELQEREENN